MATCIQCYGPIEADKLAMLPTARYCKACSNVMVANSNANAQRKHVSNFVASAVAVSKSPLTIKSAFVHVDDEDDNDNGYPFELVLCERVLDSGKIERTIIGDDKPSKKSKKQQKKKKLLQMKLKNYKSLVQYLQMQRE